MTWVLPPLHSLHSRFKVQGISLDKLIPACLHSYYSILAAVLSYETHRIPDANLTRFQRGRETKLLPRAGDIILTENRERWHLDCELW